MGLRRIKPGDPNRSHDSSATLLAGWLGGLSGVPCVNGHCVLLRARNIADKDGILKEGTKSGHSCMREDTACPVADGR